MRDGSNPYENHNDRSNDRSDERRFEHYELEELADRFLRFASRIVTFSHHKTTFGEYVQAPDRIDTMATARLRLFQATNPLRRKYPDLPQIHLQ